MCGIAGIMAFDGQVALARVVAMTSMMRARGPDDEGFLVIGDQGQVQICLGRDSPADVRRRLGPGALEATASSVMGRVVFGHRRLSIVDLSAAGHQPMADPRTGLWIVFNGEIYIFREIRNELEAFGHSFQSRTDTEVILAAYAQWGPRCLDRFNGDFAFVIWDPADQSMFCARDRLGVKPFYFATDSRHFIFASEIKSILASGLHAAKPDRQGLVLSLALGMAPRPMTAFHGIWALEQSHWMRVHRDGRIERARYWALPIGRQERNMRLPDAAAELKRLLTIAVRRRLEADVPVGTFMSGGIDSTTISVLASQHHAGIKAFTLGFLGSAPDLDEVEEAQATARMWPMQHIVTRIDREALPCNVEAWIDGYEEPYYSLAANHVISQVVRQNGVKVVLNGLGGDELFGGYPYYLLPPWYGRFAAPIRSAALRGLSSRFRSRRPMMWAAASPDRVHTIAFARWSDRDLANILQPLWQMRARTEDVLHGLYAEGLEFQDNVEAFSYMDLVNYLGNHHVHRVDQFTMAESIEGRFPFLDHELVEFAFRVPTCCKVNGEKQKVVLREVAAGQIAPECLAMKKKGFGLPLHVYLHGPLSAVVQDALLGLESREMFFPEVVSAARRGELSAERTWQMAAVELWFRRFIDRDWSGHPALGTDPSLHRLGFR